MIIPKVLNPFDSLLRFAAETGTSSGGSRPPASREKTSARIEDSVEKSSLKMQSQQATKSLKLQNQDPTVLRRAAFEQASVDAQRLAEELAQHGIRNGELLTFSDLHMTALNAYCSETSYGLPHLETWIDELESKKRNWMPPTESLTSMTDSYHAYLNTLQQAALYFHEHPTDYRERTAELVAARTSFILAQGGLPDKTDDLSMYNFDAGTHTLRFGDHDVMHPVKAHLESGASLFIPGAGYVTIRDLPELGSLPNPVILNDSNPFVHDVLKRSSELLQTKNIQVIEGRFEEVQPQDHSVGVMILSQLYGAGETALTHLLQNARRFMRQDGSILGLNPDQTQNSHEVPTPLLKELLQNADFRMIFRSARPYEIPGTWIPEDPSYLLRLTPDELLAQHSVSSSKMLYGTLSSFIAKRR